MVSAALREVFAAEDLEDARERSASVIERLTPVAPKVAELLTEAEEDLLAVYRPTTWSRSTRRSPGDRTSSASSPTTVPSSVWSGLS
jgi:hypothetical protein